jgi:BON domain
MSSTAPSLAEAIAHRVAAQTGRRVQNLKVELSDGRIILRGRASTYHVKQLAQHAAQDTLSAVLVVNAIVVE